jgi:RhtB (resistance to homoserine/threonine) family protein
MIDTSYWLLFLSAALALNLSPGPDLFFVLSRTLGHGRRVGLAAVAGVCSGAMVHVLAAALGLSLLLAAAPTLFAMLTYVGAAYLVWLGVSMWRSAGAAFLPKAATQQGVSAGQAFWQGVLVDVLNPKVVVFFMAFLPQFVREGHGSATAQLLLLGTLVVLGAFVVETLAVLGADQLAAWLRSNTAVTLWLERILGGIMVLLGLTLAFTTL